MKSNIWSLTSFVLFVFILFSLSLYSCDEEENMDINEPTQEETSENESDEEEENEPDQEEENESEQEVDGESEQDSSQIFYGENYIVFEAEATDSPFDLWVKREPGDPEYMKYFESNPITINDTYLEFTGNDLNYGPAKSPLEYTFIAPKTAEYRVVMRMHQPLRGGEPDDKRNDVFIRLSGDFSSACKYSTDDLKSNHKFFGRGQNRWGASANLEGHISGEKVLAPVIYSLKKDQEYTFTMSGRAQGCSIDYILFYESSEKTNVNHRDLLTQFPDFLPE